MDLVWDQSYSVNVAEIDRQHQKMAVLLDVLFEAIEAGRPQSVLSGIVKELVAYAGYHFETEETLMERYKYPEVEVHKKEHDGFRRKVAAFQTDLSERKETLPGDLIKFMTHWLSDHIVGTDKKYGPFLNACGVF